LLTRTLIACVWLALSACAASTYNVADVDMLTIRRRPDTVLMLRTSAPSDSVVLPRGSNTVVLSAQDAIEHLEAKLGAHPHLGSDSALLAIIADGLRSAGWVRLSPEPQSAVERQNFLIAELLMRGRVAIRQGSTTALAPEVRLIFWGNCEMANGRGWLLPDSTEVMRTVDGWHGCFDA
jgi:hypothetical protein